MQEIKEKIALLSLGRSTENLDHFNSLQTEEEKADYILQNQDFWHTMNSFNDIFSDIYYSIIALEKIRIRRDEEVIKGEGLGSDIFNPIKPLSRLLCHSISILIKFILALKIINEDNFAKEFKELQFLRLLRNEFIQHPKIPVETIGGVQISGDKKIIPFAQLGPGGGGWAFITSYNQGQIKDSAFMKMKPKEQLEKNKYDFVKIGGWAKASNNQDLKTRIKGVGLPLIDQEKLATEIRSLFILYIYPHFQKLTSDARLRKVLI